MAVVLKCVECGHSEQSEDAQPQSCPMCEGNMAPPKARAASKAATKTKKASKQEEPLSLDDDAGGRRDGTAARRLELDPGFDDDALVHQVEGWLKPDEVLHWVGRRSMEIVQKKAWKNFYKGIFLIVVGIVVAIYIARKPTMPGIAILAPLLFILVAAMITFLVPALKLHQGRHGWYALTNKRAIVFSVLPFSKRGGICSYLPKELQRLKIEISKWVTGGGSLIFRTEIHTTTTTTYRRRGPTTLKSSRSIVHYGYLDIDHVRQVALLLREVIFGIEAKGVKVEEDDSEDEELDKDDAE